VSSGIEFISVKPGSAKINH